MSGKHHRNASRSGRIRNLAQLLDEYRTLACQILDHMLVMHDLPTHIHRWQTILTVELPRRFRSLKNRLHGENRTIHTSAKPARVGEHHTFGHRNLLNVNTVLQCKAGTTGGYCQPPVPEPVLRHLFKESPRFSRTM